MSIRVIGAGVGRTGTNSLQLALQTLLAGRCYHMHELFERRDDILGWQQAADGNMPDWRAFFSEFVAAVDWPACSYWAEIAATFPDALIVLSIRDPEDWWRSASQTIFPASLQVEDPAWRQMMFDTFERRFTRDIENKDAAIAAFEAHNAHVRSTAPADRLLEWRASDGWGPLCEALELPVPAEDFPHVNKAENFHDRDT